MDFHCYEPSGFLNDPIEVDHRGQIGYSTGLQYDLQHQTSWYSINLMTERVDQLLRLREVQTNYASYPQAHVINTNKKTK